MTIFCDDSYLMASNTDENGNPIQNGVQYFGQCFSGCIWAVVTKRLQLLDLGPASFCLWALPGAVQQELVTG
jgi:hypothetical protein